MKTFVIDGANFDTIEQFYEEIGRQIVPTGQWGMNLDALNDVLSGGFGAFDAGEEVELVWKNAYISREKLREKFETIVEIIKEHKHMHFKLM